MKQYALPHRAAALLCVCAFVLTGCGSGASSSSGAESAGASPGQSSGSQPPASSVSSQAEESSVSVESPAAIAPLEDGAVHTVSLTPMNETGIVVLSLTVPGDWSFDSYTTFSNAFGKVAEVVGAWKVDNPLNPFAGDIVDSYAFDTEGMYPEGYGLQSTLDKSINGNLMRTYLYKSWPDDAAQPWYPHYVFYVLNNYVVQISFYSFEASDLDPIFDSVIASATLTQAQ